MASRGNSFVETSRTSRARMRQAARITGMQGAALHYPGHLTSCCCEGSQQHAHVQAGRGVGKLRVKGSTSGKQHNMHAQHSASCRNAYALVLAAVLRLLCTTTSCSQEGLGQSHRPMQASYHFRSPGAPCNAHTAAISKSLPKHPTQGQHTPAGCCTSPQKPSITGPRRP